MINYAILGAHELNPNNIIFIYLLLLVNQDYLDFT